MFGRRIEKKTLGVFLVAIMCLLAGMGVVQVLDNNDVRILTPASGQIINQPDGIAISGVIKRYAGQVRAILEVDDHAWYRRTTELVLVDHYNYYSFDFIWTNYYSSGYQITVKVLQADGASENLLLASNSISVRVDIGDGMGEPAYNWGVFVGGAPNMPSPPPPAPAPAPAPAPTPAPVPCGNPCSPPPCNPCAPPPVVVTPCNPCAPPPVVIVVPPPTPAPCGSPCNPPDPTPPPCGSPCNPPDPTPPPCGSACNPPPAPTPMPPEPAPCMSILCKIKLPCFWWCHDDGGGNGDNGDNGSHGNRGHDDKDKSRDNDKYDKGDKYSNEGNYQDDKYRNDDKKDDDKYDKGSKYGDDDKKDGKNRGSDWSSNWSSGWSSGR